MEAVSYTHLDVYKRQDKLRLGPAHRFCRVFPDFALYKPGAIPQAGLAHKLGAVGPLGSHIFLLYLKNLAMHKAVEMCIRDSLQKSRNFRV